MDRENGDGDIEGGGGADDGGFRSPIGRKYHPVLANDRAVLEMSSMDQGPSSSSSAFPDQHPNIRYSPSSRFRRFRFVTGNSCPYQKKCEMSKNLFVFVCVNAIVRCCEGIKVSHL